MNANSVVESLKRPLAKSSWCAAVALGCRAIVTPDDSGDVSGPRVEIEPSQSTPDVKVRVVGVRDKFQREFLGFMVHDLWAAYCCEEAADAS